jgi:hypothetical protein
MPQSQRDATGERSISLAEGHEMTGVQDVLYDSTHLALIHNVKTGTISNPDDTELTPRTEPRMHHINQLLIRTIVTLN